MSLKDGAAAEQLDGGRRGGRRAAAAATTTTSGSGGGSVLRGGESAQQWLNRCVGASPPPHTRSHTRARVHAHMHIHIHTHACTNTTTHRRTCTPPTPTQARRHPLSRRAAGAYVQSLLRESTFKKLFGQPVPRDTPQYHQIIANPMDLGTIKGVWCWLWGWVWYWVWCRAALQLCAVVAWL